MLTHVHTGQNELEITHSQDYFYSHVLKPDMGYLYPMSENQIYQRVKQRLDAIGMSERQASIKAVGNSQFVRNMRKGLSASPRGENIVKLSRVLGVSESWLLGTSDDPGTPASEQSFGVRFGGRVEAGSWRTADSENQDGEYRVIPAAPDPRYPLKAQFAFLVAGDSMNKAMILPGMYVLALDISVWERHHRETTDGLVVIVQRMRNGDGEYERTIKRLRIFRDRVELQPESDNDKHHPIVIANGDQDSHCRVVAVALTASWVLA